MNLPNYFLADLPPEATLSAAMIEEACRTLKKNREQFLANRSTQSMIKLLCEVAENWLQADYPFRKLALEKGPAATSFSQATLTRGLDSFFKQLTPENFHALLMQDIGHAQRLDQMNSSAMVCGPEFVAHIAAGNIPNPTLMSIVLSVLTRSAQFVKCATGSSFLPRLFAHSLYDADNKLGACMEIAEWRGGNTAVETALFAEVDCVTATGSDETLEKIRHQLPLRVRFLGYGHRVSFGFIAAEVSSGFGVKKLVTRVADDITAWDQHGCLSPHVIYTERGGASPEEFAEMLSEELDRREASEPRGTLLPETAAVIASRRSIYEVRAAHSPNATRVWRSKDSTAWTVVYEADSRFQLSCLNRFVYVKGVASLEDMLQSADSVRGKVSTVGLAAPPDKTEEYAVKLAKWGVTRVCPIGQMQNPPLTWRHDGRPSLGDLIRWTDFES